MLCTNASRTEDSEVHEIPSPEMRGLPSRRGEAVGLFGVNYRSEDFHRLSGLRIPQATRLERLDLIQRELGLGELLYLSTCNRVEFVYRAEQPILDSSDPRLTRLLQLLDLPAEAAGSFHIYSGTAAVRYAFEVASALDSMVVGEAQILGQFKRAFQTCRAEGRIGSVLNALCETAFRVAKDVRNATGLATRKLSLVSLVSDELRCHLSVLPRPTIALIGAGEMIAKVACLVSPCKDFHPARLLFVNRTPEHAESLAQSHGGEVMSLQSFLAAPPKVDLLVTATSAGDPLLGHDQLAAMLPDGPAGLLVVDLAVPGDVDRSAAGLDGLRLVGIEDFCATTPSSTGGRASPRFPTPCRWWSRPWPDSTPWTANATWRRAPVSCGMHSMRSSRRSPDPGPSWWSRGRTRC